MHYMILMSKKMTSQKKFGEIKSVPYNKPLMDCGCHWRGAEEECNKQKHIQQGKLTYVGNWY